MVRNWLPRPATRRDERPSIRQVFNPSSLQSVKSSIRQAIIAGEVLERGFRPRAEVLDHFARGQRAEAAAGAIVGTAGETGQETRGEQIAGACGVDDTLDRKSRHRLDAV